jgi:hypothetical protein
MKRYCVASRKDAQTPKIRQTAKMQKRRMRRAHGDRTRHAPRATRLLLERVDGLEFFTDLDLDGVAQARTLQLRHLCQCTFRESSRQRRCEHAMQARRRSED